MTGWKVGPLWLVVESGPPIIWIPRAGLVRKPFPILSLGLGWWIVSLARGPKEADGGR